MLLERARTVLLDRDTRAKYDQWREGGLHKWMGFDDGLSVQSRVHTVSPSSEQGGACEGGREDSNGELGWPWHSFDATVWGESLLLTGSVVILL